MKRQQEIDEKQYGGGRLKRRTGDDSVYSSTFSTSSIPSSTASTLPSRTVYVGNIPATATLDQLLDLVHSGPIESCRFYAAERGCAFIDFVNAAHAQQFLALTAASPSDHPSLFADTVQPSGGHTLSINGHVLKISSAKASTVNNHLIAAISAGATRNVYFGAIDEFFMTEGYFRTTLERFGMIDTVKVVKDKKIAFVHFDSVAHALAAIEGLSGENEWTGRRLHFGRDRCSSTAANSGSVDISENRTVYFGGLPAGITIQDITNLIKGGQVFSVNVIDEKKCAFVSFVDPAAALLIVSQGTYMGFTLNGHRLKVNWGKPLQLPSAMIMAIYHGATKNIYINTQNMTSLPTKESLTADFSKYGEIESVTILNGKNIAFVNFASIPSAVSALTELKNSVTYGICKMMYGRDRCAEPNPNAASIQTMNTYSAYQQAMIMYHQNAIAGQHQSSASATGPTSIIPYQ